MFRLVAAALLALLVSPAAASAAQPLTIDLRAAAPRIDKLDRYVTGEVLAISVLAPRASAVTLAGVGPDGSNLRVPLAAGPAGMFAGTVTLPIAGAWSLAAATTIDRENISTESFPLLAVEPESRLPATIMAVLAFASVAGGIGLIVVARRNSAESTA